MIRGLGREWVLATRRNPGGMWTTFRTGRSLQRSFLTWLLAVCSARLRAMAVEDLFTQALGLSSPWHVVCCDFDPAAKSLKLVIDFERGARFADPETGEPCPVHDTVQRRWEHLRFFEHRTTIEARVPRIKTASGAVKTVEVPWAKLHGGFTLLMEAYLLILAKVMPVAEVSRQTLVSEDRIWHLIRTRVEDSWEKTDWSSLERLGVDETSTRKGHKYGTVFLEIDGQETERGRGGSKVARLLFFTPGKGADTFKQFAIELERRAVPAEQINEIAMDMSRAFIVGAAEHFPDAQLCFDRFHVMKLCGEALDQVRKDIARSIGGLPRGAMWALRGNPTNLREDQLELRKQICKEHTQIARGLSIREFLADMWNYQLREDADEHLRSVISWCRRSRLKPFVKLAKTLKSHLDGILGYFKNYTTSAAIEAVNGLLQLARRRARGYRTFRNFRAMAYWIAGGLSIEPRVSTTH
ncbi:MAG: ISL3 family transposase [Roseibacillus sp.]